jgi:carbon storage regulator
VLVLTRRKDQRIMIGDDIVVTVLDVKGDTVRIGIEAPLTVQVHREEVHQTLSEANREALLPSRSAVDLPDVSQPGAPAGSRVRGPH